MNHASCAGPDLDYLNPFVLCEVRGHRDILIGDRCRAAGTTYGSGIVMTASGFPISQSSVNAGTGGRSLTSPFGAPAATHRAINPLSASLSRRSLENWPFGAAECHGGIAPVATFSRIEAAQGRFFTPLRRRAVTWARSWPARWQLAPMLVDDWRDLFRKNRRRRTRLSPRQKRYLLPKNITTDHNNSAQMAALHWLIHLLVRTIFARPVGLVRKGFGRIVRMDRDLGSGGRRDPRCRFESKSFGLGRLRALAHKKRRRAKLRMS